MKRKITVLTLTAALLLTACTGGEPAASAGAEGQAGDQESVQNAAAEETNTAESKDEEDAEGTGEILNANKASSGKVTLNIYYSNEMADGLEMTEMEADAVTPELLLSSLSTYRIVTQDTKVRSVEVIQEAEETIVCLDLSKEFGTYVSTMGTSGEYVIIAALTNTFLDAYQADKLRLTVEGKYLESGHALYDWDLTRYQMTSYTVETEVYEKGKIRLEYPQLVNVKNSFTETEWNEIFEEYAKKDLEYLKADTEYTLLYETATATEELLSVVYRIESCEPGAAHPYSYIETFNIDFESGQAVRLSDFMDTAKVVKCLSTGTGYQVLNNDDVDVQAVQDYVGISPDMLTEEYFDSFDLNFAAPEETPVGYSYKKDGQVVVCLEVNHALGDFVEIQIQ